MLNGIDTPVHDLDRLIQYHKGRLQARQLYQRLHGPRIRLPASLDLLSSLAQAGQGKVIDIILGKRLELWEKDTRDIFLFGTDAEAGVLDGFLDLVGDVAARGVGDFSQGEGGNLHDTAHLAFGFVNTFQDFWQAFSMQWFLWITAAYLESACEGVSITLVLGRMLLHTWSRLHSSS